MALDTTIADQLDTWPLHGLLPTPGPSQGLIGLLAAPPPQPTLGGVLGATFEPARGIDGQSVFSPPGRFGLSNLNAAFPGLPGGAPLSGLPPISSQGQPMGLLSAPTSQATAGGALGVTLDSAGGVASPFNPMLGIGGSRPKGLGSSDLNGLAADSARQADDSTPAVNALRAPSPENGLGAVRKGDIDGLAGQSTKNDPQDQVPSNGSVPGRPITSNKLPLLPYDPAKDFYLPPNQGNTIYTFVPPDPRFPVTFFYTSGDFGLGVGRVQEIGTYTYNGIDGRIYRGQFGGSGFTVGLGGGASFGRGESTSLDGFFGGSWGYTGNDGAYAVSGSGNRSGVSGAMGFGLGAGAVLDHPTIVPIKTPAPIGHWHQ